MAEKSSRTQPPGNKNLYLAALLSTVDGSPMLDVDGCMGPNFDIKSLYVYASGGISKISFPSHIVFCILEESNNSGYLTRSACE